MNRPGWILLLSLLLPKVDGQICQFSWKNPVSGSFEDAGRWSPGPPPPAGPAGCQGRAPMPGENVDFRQGTYTVSIPGIERALVAEFGIAGAPPFDPWDITMAVTGSMQADTLATSGRLTVTGSGTFVASTLYNMGPDASFVLDQAVANIGNVLKSEPGPADRSRQFWIRNKASLTTFSKVPIYGITVDGATWHHTGAADAKAFPDQILITNGGLFDASAVALSGTPLLAEAASTVNIAQFQTLNRVRISGGSQMVNQSATLRFGDAIVDGTGSKWTISRLELPDSAPVFSTNRAELICDQVLFSDPNGITSLSARGTDSRVTVRQPLLLAPGNANAADGGIFRVPSAQLGSGGRVNVGKGPGGLGGAQFNCEGKLEIGRSGANTAASFNVNGGGRAAARSVEIGFSTVGNILALNASGGTAEFDVDQQILVGHLGQGSVTVANGAHLQFTQPGGAIIITSSGTGNGDASVDGADSQIDLKTGVMHVGRFGTARLTVTGGGKLFGGSLNVGDIDGPTNRLATVVGANSKILLEQGAAYVGNGTLRVANGGFVQITSGTIEGQLLLQAPALIDMTTGIFEIGNAGGSPVGIMRVDRGALRGSGVIRASSMEVIAQGRCAPGDFVVSNQLRIDGGSYLQDANGTLEIDIYGKGATQFGTLNVARGISLNGKLVLNFVRDFEPRTGDELGFIHFGEGITGSFSSIEVHGLKPGVKLEQKLLAPGVYGVSFLSDGADEDCTEDAPKIDAIDDSVPGIVTLSITAGSCGFPRVEYSDDLKSWHLLSVFTVDFFGQARVTDRNAPLSNTRFYRVVRL